MNIFSSTRFDIGANVSYYLYTLLTFAIIYRTTYHGMYNHHQRVTKDLEYKNQALETDRRLIEIRKPLHGPDDTEFKRNVGYCRLSDELVTN